MSPTSSEVTRNQFRGALGQFSAGFAAALHVNHAAISPALHFGTAAAAGGLCTSFAWGLAGAIIGAAMGSLFLIVWVLVPDIGEASKVLPSKDEYSTDLVEMRGVEFVRAFGSFGKLASEEGPFPVVAMLMAMLAFVSSLFGFLLGPMFGDGVMERLGVALAG